MKETKTITIFGVIGESISIFFKNFFLIVSIVITGAIPMLVYLYMLSDGSAMDDKGKLLLIFAVILPLCIIMGLASFGAVIKAFSSLYRGEKTGFISAYSTGFSRMFRMLATGVFCYFIFLGGAVMLIIPAFIFMVKYMLAFPSSVLDDTRVSPLKMSSKLTKGHMWKIFFTFIIIYVLLMLPWILIIIFNGVYTAGKTMYDFKTMLLMSIPGILLGPILEGIIVLFYEKLKDLKKDEIKEEELKGMNTPLGCLMSALLLIGVYAVLIAGVMGITYAMKAVKKTETTKIESIEKTKPEKQAAPVRSIKADKTPRHIKP